MWVRWTTNTAFLNLLLANLWLRFLRSGATLKRKTGRGGQKPVTLLLSAGTFPAAGGIVCRLYRLDGCQCAVAHNSDFSCH